MLLTLPSATEISDECQFGTGKRSVDLLRAHVPGIEGQRTCCDAQWLGEAVQRKRRGMNLRFAGNGGWSEMLPLS